MQIITTAEVNNLFKDLGYCKIQVETNTVNGVSHYVTLTVEVLNELKCWRDMTCDKGLTTITVRISDHFSGLEKNCDGVSGNRMTLLAFKKLIASGAIKDSN